MAASSAAPGALADRVVPAAPGSNFDLYIFTSYEKPGWHARVGGDRLKVPHPGSAISYQDAVYEVIELGPAPSTPYPYRYALRKWEDRFVVRQIFPYSAEAVRSEVRQVQETRRQYRQHSWLVRLFPITGLLPSPLLRRWERDWGLPMRRASWASAVLFGLIGLNWTIYSGNLLAFFFTVESVLRFFWLLGSREAVGSFTATAVWGLWNVMRGREPDGSPRRRKSVEDFAAERDEVRRLKEQPWDIEVRSLFRDPVLLGPDPVRFEDAVYEPLGYEQQGHGLDRRYVFRLKKLDGASTAQRDYSPQRTQQQVLALMKYERARDRAHRWLLLCGCLPGARQIALEQRYDLQATLATERSAWVLLLAAALQFASLLVRKPGPGEVLAIYLAGESLYRLALARSRGEPCGSLFGLLLSPFLKFE